MKKILNYSYLTIFLIFTIFTFVEVLKYLFIESCLVGIFYLITSLIIMFFLFTMSLNFKKGNLKIRLSKVILVFILGMFASYLLPSIVINNMNYTDISNEYIKSVWFILKVLKPFLYVSLVVLGYLEFRVKK